MSTADRPLTGTETELRAMLADLHREYQTRAEPILNALAAIEATKPPRPFIITSDNPLYQRFVADKDK